jgi:two-component system, NtrC family, C4-dicarboxylate transport response regulator DctD
MSTTNGQVIFVDDDESVRMANMQSLRLAGFTVTAYPDAPSALPHITADFDGVIVSDIRMPEIDGLQFFRAVQEIDPDIPLVLITGHGDVAMAVSALKAGAHDFLTKPFAADHLIASVQRACSMRALLLDNRRLHQAADIALRDSPLIGETPAMVNLRDMIAQLARANVDVIVEGETGTGKELVAGMLHRASCRRLHSLVSVTCGWAAPEIVETDLFGDTVAGRARTVMSPIEAAHKGTLFLEDADRLPLSAQSRLIRLLDDGILRGSRAGTERPVDIKIIASCQGQLLQAVKDGRFREDLYYRLNMARLVLPPLRERKADLPLLFAHFVSEALPKADMPLPDITDDVRRRLIDHNWPGNARELKTFATRFALGLIEPADTENNAATLSLVGRVRLYEESLIRTALTRCNGDVSAAVADLKLPRKTFYDKLSRHGIDIRRFRHK